MLRLPGIVGTLVLMALLPLHAEAQDKGKARLKPKLCVNGAESSVASSEGCNHPKRLNTPAPLQIGGSSFGSGGSKFQGGASGNDLAPKLREGPFRPPAAAMTPRARK
jgi:hypothetical protein